METDHLTHVTPDELLGYFKLAQCIYRQWDIVAGEPHTNLQPGLIHLMMMNQLHEATRESSSLHNALKKEQDERDAKQINENKGYLDLSMTANKYFDEKTKQFQELESKATLRHKEKLENCERDKKLQKSVTSLP
jgi:hypothetical protein